jgi:hypothetical protein
VAELTDYHQKESTDSTSVPTARALRPIEKDFAIVCISVSDQADELTTLMLVQLMERASHQTLLLTAASVSSEILDSLATEPDTVVFISALPPFAFSQARAICQRVRSHLPNNRIVVGLWNSATEPDQTAEQAIERFGSGKPNVVVNSLAQALQQITHWHHQQHSQYMRF